MSDTSAVPAVPEAGGAVAIPEDDMTGLEDFKSSDMVMPRLQIDHLAGKFKDNLSGQEYDELTVVLLGLVKQRILWADEVEEGDKPLCKSYEFTTGNPDVTRFPWKESGFDKDTLVLEEGLTLPCDGCALKEWGTNPRGNSPWCAEQHTYPLLMNIGGGWSPALFTVQRTGIKPSKTYLTSFARTHRPTYTVFTRLGLSPQKRGTVSYAVPIFTQAGETDESDYAWYAMQYRTIREIVQRPPQRDDDDSSASPSSAPATPVAPPPAAASPAAPASADDDDDLPF